MSRLDDQRDSSVRESPPCYLVLGLLSALSRLEHLEPPQPFPNVAPLKYPSAFPPGSNAERLLCFALGLIYFRQHLRSIVVGPEPQPASPSDPVSEPKLDDQNLTR